ncbi:MAG: hypothetical protein ACI90V_012181 [Bacillariaceae sp.]|jgi:hypothetical protein
MIYARSNTKRHNNWNIKHIQTERHNYPAQSGRSQRTTQHNETPFMMDFAPFFAHFLLQKVLVGFDSTTTTTTNKQTNKQKWVVVKRSSSRSSSAIIKTFYF